ncbi:unnamed protein product, partial [Mesorhabditis belari]|uniref:Uncharacterized protein n=1 Tax=Mesorhabditis belari TaxID=2138241 RepID=A0AAF3FPY4_9BILA
MRRNCLDPFFDREKVFQQKKYSCNHLIKERTLESAQAVAASLFPPTGNRVRNASFLWQPTPIHSHGIDRAQDMILRPKASGCPRYKRLNTTDRVKSVHQIEKNYADFFKYLSNMTGNEINGLNVAHLFELGIEIKNGLPQPDWHDDGLFALLSALGLLGDEMIPTAAVILFEIHRNHSIDKCLTVQILYRNTTKYPPYLMEIPKCSNPCPLKDFLKIYEPMRVSQ